MTKRNFGFSFLLVLSFILLSACSSGKRNPLVGRWKVETYADPFKATLGATTLTSDENYILMFQETGLFSFTTDCNTISGDYIVRNQNLRFENTAATELACDSEIVERSIKSQLPMVESFDFPDDSTLCLLGREGNVLVRLIRTDL